jgi:hypothetical protein
MTPLCFTKGHCTPPEGYANLDKRANLSTCTLAIVDANGNPVAGSPFTWRQPDWRSAGDWPNNAPVYRMVIVYEDEDDCENARVRVIQYANRPAGGLLSMPHILPRLSA